MKREIHFFLNKNFGGEGLGRSIYIFWGIFFHFLQFTKSDFNTYNGFLMKEMARVS
jgi:hypothetical protein